MRHLLFFLLFSISIFGSLPKAVVFDYGGVIAKVDRKPVIEFLSASLNKPYRKVKKDFALDKLYKAFNQEPAFWEEYAMHSLPDSWFDELESYKKGIIREIPGMRELVQKIKDQGIQVVLLSNTNAHRARFIELMGGYDLFDPILLSCYLDTRKPEPKMYRSLLQSLIWDARDTLFIDNRKSNVDAGMQFGMDGIVFESVEQLKTELAKRELIVE